jgi:HSP20 family protein
MKRHVRNWSSRLRREPLHALREELDELLSRFFGSGEEGWFAGRLAPALDLSETDAALEIRLDLPGLKPEGIDVHLSGGTLTVSGERVEETGEKDRTIHRSERRTGRFSRSVTLPCGVDEDAASAQYRDGVLIITLPKRAEERSRRIEITR